MFSGINTQFGNTNRLLEKENSGQLSTLSLKNTTNGGSSAPLQPSALKQKLYGNSAPLGTERKALGEITNTAKPNSLANKKLLTTSSTGETKLLFVPTSLNPQIRKKAKSTIKPIINQSIISKAKKAPVPLSPQQPLHDNNTVYSAPPAPLRLSSKLTNESIESLIMTPSYDIPITGYTESYEENIYKFDQSEYQATDDHSLMIEDNFSFSDYYQDIVL
ncbi:hypothetical protein DICPUDRAFT_34679 [Dictyostelium purpureum]|uniref:Uncharacterized protein n=1 Tax=Dictyostelium purpureum TaxID=5786 RepID=F0ZN45_DICPU|nr:uncharacterized protein DICPUDRAFT_34679 [Dictyostelium purpureum]EGC34613.1 hypothetical protein DICPUDRAFT_34679 [Dictyostelium purpureum]|eukprot:XP_003288838.1 hypothetical protein DICPUDRAFT_34679 [Dictyostelium purpureum]